MRRLQPLLSGYELRWSLDNMGQDLWYLRTGTTERGDNLRSGRQSADVQSALSTGQWFFFCLIHNDFFVRIARDGNSEQPSVMKLERDFREIWNN